jgi:hypothetical protein
LRTTGHAVCFCFDFIHSYYAGKAVITPLFAISVIETCSGIDIPAMEAVLAYYVMSTGSLFPGVSGRSLKLTTGLHIVLKLTISGDVSPLLRISSSYSIKNMDKFTYFFVRQCYSI